jgi:hypothetical protein
VKTFCLVGISLCLSVAAFVERPQASHGQAIPEVPLSLGATVADSFVCPGDPDVFTMHVLPQVTLTNNDQKKWTVPVTSRRIYEIRIAASVEDLRAGRLLGEYEPTTYTVGSAVIDRSQFEEVLPGNSISLPDSILLTVPVAYKTMAGLPTPGSRVVGFKWNPWTSGNRTGAYWRRELGSDANLLLRSLSAVVAVNIPAGPPARLDGRCAG